MVTLLGRNGAGKTTTMKSIMGLVPRREGSIRFKGDETIGFSPDRVARAGIAFCPEERGIFASLNVTENLMLPPQIAPGGMSIAEIHELFPNLKERAGSQGTKLSGGEQQMLAIGRILRTGLPAAAAGRADGGTGARSSSSRSGARSVTIKARGSRCCWWSRTSDSRRRSRIGIM